MKSLNLLNYPSRFAALMMGMLALSQRGQTQNAQPVTPPDATQFPATVTLSTEKPAIFLGEPIFMSFVVHNPTATEWGMITGGDYRNRLGRPESFKIEVRDEQGNLVPQPSAGIGLGGLVGAQKLPAQGDYKFSLFLPHWATFAAPGHYRITARRTLLLFTGDKKDILQELFKPNSTLVKVPAEASASLNILPVDEQKMVALIEQWGKVALQSPNNSGFDRSNDATKLRAVNDPRAVPFLVRAVERPNPDALDIYALGRFDDDTAFQTLQKLASQTSAKDITNASTLQVAGEMADQVRHNAAYAISHSPHAGAAEFLLSLRHDPYYAVRLTVVQNIDTLPRERAQAIWREMVTDSNADVRSEAERYLKKSEM